MKKIEIVALVVVLVYKTITLSESIATPLRALGIKVMDAVIVLRAKGKLDEEMGSLVLKFLEENKKVVVPKVEKVRVKSLGFEERVKLAKNPTGKKLFEVMVKKQSNLCLVADVRIVAELLDVVEKVIWDDFDHWLIFICQESL